MNIDGIKDICVVGWGRSGMALAKVVLSLNKKARVTELKEHTDFARGSGPDLVDEMARCGVRFEFGGHSDDFIKGADLVVVSPGVDTTTSQAAKIAQRLNIPCVGEIEFASWLTQAKIVAITGTNGKTTTTFLTHAVLKQKKDRVFLGGNIGTPFSSFVLDTRKDDLIVLEISSFQMETIIEFRPYVACLLNIEPDHLDRYPAFKDYFEAKANIFRNQREDDWAVLNRNMDVLADIEKKIKARITYFSSEFNNANYSCVYRTAAIFGLSKAECQRVFADFRGLPHRLQIVRQVNGVTFINDSKATNPSSTVWALQNIKSPVILIAGGKDKGLDYSQIKPYMDRVKKVNLIGQAAAKIKEALAEKIAADIYPSLKEATEASFRQAESNDAVILSPMCSSFDQFLNYEDRGDKFVEIVNGL